MSEPRITEAIKMLRCADINCDNVRKLGFPAVAIVKMRIAEAIKPLEPDDE